MGKRQPPFDAYRDKNLQEGVLYSIVAAKAINENIKLLSVQNHINIMKRIRNTLTAVSFDVADKSDTPREIMAGGVGESENCRCEKIISDFLDPRIVSISRMNRTLKPKSVIRIFTRSPGPMPMSFSLGIRTNQ
jgi:hypothetical protein